MDYYNSRYNFCFRTEEGVLLYNSNVGSTFKVKGTDAEALSIVLTGEKKFLGASSFDNQLLDTFLKNGFLVEANRDELLEIRERYWAARGATPMVLTITTTMNCNLGCYYCYEERTQKKLEFNDTSVLIERLQKSFEHSPQKSLHVDWYGGEPLLNIEFLEQASFELQSFCKENDINYHASIISNGTLWPENIEQFITSHKIRQVQISFDGLKENHNKRRRYRKEFLKGSDNSYDIIVSLIDRLLEVVHVDIRFNIDWKNKDDVHPFLDIIIEKGWFNKRFPAVFQPARLASYTEKSSFMAGKQLSIEEFDEIRRSVATKLNGVGQVEESEVPDGFPFPKNYVCAALASNSFVIGADKLVYRCGLQVGETHRAVDSLENDGESNYKDANWWDEFDPTYLPSCSKCSFLPVCLGGCPKKHLEGDQMALDEQSEYWRNNLAMKVANYLGENLTEESVISESQQFRVGYD